MSTKIAIRKQAEHLKIGQNACSEEDKKATVLERAAKIVVFCTLVGPGRHQRA